MMNEPETAGEPGGAVTLPDSPGARQRGWLRALPAMRGLLPIDRSHVPADLLAGLTLAALGIPEVLGYDELSHEQQRFVSGTRRSPGCRW